MSKKKEADEDVLTHPELPCFMFKDNGPHKRKGGTYTYKLANTKADYEMALKAGWVSVIDELD